jgi:hypothetical protein
MPRFCHPVPKRPNVSGRNSELKTMTQEPLITTVERHFLDRRARNPHATEEFSWLLSGITLATKIIAAHMQRASPLEIMGDADRINVQGEAVQKLDVFANETLRRCLGYRGNIGILVSEEDEEPHVMQEAAAGKYIVLFDPLDGSSNINANVSIGSKREVERVLSFKDIHFGPARNGSSRASVDSVAPLPASRPAGNRRAVEARRGDQNVTVSAPARADGDDDIEARLWPGD